MDRRLALCHFRTPPSSRDQLYSQRWPECHLRLGTRRRPTLTCPLRSRRQLEARFANMVGTDACVGAHHRSRSSDNCTTSTSANHRCRTNVASVFDRFGGCYMVGALAFSLFLKIGPIPSPGAPRSTPGLEPGIAPSPPRLAPGRCACCSGTNC